MLFMFYSLLCLTLFIGGLGCIKLAFYLKRDYFMAGLALCTGIPSAVLGFSCLASRGHSVFSLSFAATLFLLAFPLELNLETNDIPHIQPVIDVRLAEDGNLYWKIGKGIIKLQDILSN